MANKRIVDYSTLEEGNDNDLILVASNSETYNMKLQTFREACSEIATTALSVANSAVSQAAAAQVAADNAQSDAESAGDAAAAVARTVQNLSDTVDGKIDDAYVEDGYLYLTSGGEIVAGPIGPFAGGGGSGGGGATIQYTISLSNLLPSRSITAAAGNAAYLSFSYVSVDDTGDTDGDGVGTIIVNNLTVGTVSVPQGNNLLDVSSYLASGSNTVKIRVENSEGSSRTLSYNVTLIELLMATTFDALGTYSGPVTFSYTVTGSGTKRVYFLMDGVQIGYEDVSSSGRSRSYSIPTQTDGAHILAVYAEVTESGTTITSNVVRLGMIWTSALMSAPAVSSTFSDSTITQGDPVTIPYLVYDPQTEQASIELIVYSVDENEARTAYRTQTITVDRTARSWTVSDFPVGDVVFRIQCGTAYWEKAVTAAESGVEIEPITDALAFHFSPEGRSNAESTPAQWTDETGDISASFTGIGFSQSDGWLTDSDGTAILRILPGGAMTLPFKLFESDARALGATIEVEMATHNVRDYDTVVLSCLSNGRGFKIASQYAQLNSEASSLSMQFKEDEKVRVTFSVEARSLNRLIYIYVDGIMCGVTQYPLDDNFQQTPAVGITVGAQSSGIDVYRIRMYTKGLTKAEVLDNFIADRPTATEKVAAYRRNDIFDLSDNIVVSKLPLTLPYMIIKCAELPQSKGDKKTCAIDYINPSDSSKNFTAMGIEIDVQGTSSAGYKKKNFKWKIKSTSSLVYTQTGAASATYKLRDTSIAAKAFCMKADVASSEGANNVELARAYNDICPYKTPPQVENSNIRQGIDGLPCVIFWQNTATNEVTFWGKYNFNDEKSSNEVFGLTTGCESWEIKNNTSARVIFKDADFSGDSWESDLEARYPDGSTDVTKLSAMWAWVVSTDRTAATGDALAEDYIDSDGNTHQLDNAAYRLAKFKTEFSDHFIKDACLFYYLFTETFLMVDSRAKNLFPSSYDGGDHWLPLPYDFDTALGINNEGALVFDYDLEDTDTVSGADVFNGQNSVLWCNVRDAFPDDLKAMYTSLRSGPLFSYQAIISRFTAHQAVWPEAIWNEDAWQKYLEPLENDNDGTYLDMLQGSKASQREWWLFNGFRYRDSKYQCGDAQAQFITLRCYAVGNITVTPYSHIWPRILYGSYTVTARGKRNIATTLACPLASMNDTEVYIYSADRLAAIGDLSPLQVGYANFSMATKLTSLKLGDGDALYENTRLYDVQVGNNELLESLDVRNCTILATNIDLSCCASIKTILASGSAITGVTLPVGGKLQTLDLPGTITNLTLRDQAEFVTLTMAGYSALTTLRIENTPNVPLDAILSNGSNLNRVRLINVAWEAANETSLRATITKLESCGGMDASGNNTGTAVVTGRVSVPSISGDLLAEIADEFPELVVVADGRPLYVIRYLDYDNTLLYRASVAEGGNAINPVTMGDISAPTRAATDDTRYTFADFGTLPTNVHAPAACVAVYSETYRVQFYNESTLYDTQWIASGGNATAPATNPSKAATAQNTFTYAGWSRTPGSTTADSTALLNITAPRTLYAAYTITGRTYTVRFYNGSTLLQTVNTVPYGGTATYTGATPVSSEGSAEDYPFEGWNPSNSNIQGDTSCYAQFGSPLEVAEITDSWEDIIAAVSNGTYSSKYKIGNYKPLDLGAEGTVNMQIIGKNVDNLADGTGTASLTWLSMEELTTSHRMNPSRTQDPEDSSKYLEGTGAIGGWGKSEMRTYMKETIKPLIPQAVRDAIKTVFKNHTSYTTSSTSETQTTEDDVWLPSYAEMFNSSGATNQPRYKVVFPDNSSRIKKKIGAASASWWWLRSAYNSYSFYSVYASGSLSNGGAYYSGAVVLGFCI